MKKLLKQLICVVLALCIVGSGAVCGFVSSNAALVGGNAGSNVEWSLENGILEIIGNGSTGSYAAVSAQKAPWYNRRDEILHVKIGEGITTIGMGSLRNCGNVLDVSLPETLKEISETAFSGCNKLQQISIPAGVRKIDASAFLECAVLERITVDSANAYFTDVDGVLFSKDKTKLILFPKGKIVTEYTVPATVTQIGDYAFANCSELITVNIPSSVKAVGTSAFLNCRTLFTAEIPEGVTAIKPNTFSGCSALYEVKLPSTVTAIGSNAFGKCGSLMKINIPSAAVTIDNSAFSSSPNLTIYCNKGSFAHKYCVANSIDYFYSDIATHYPMPASTVYNGHTYGRFDVNCSWEEAKLICEMLGGHLVTISSQAENDVVTSLVSGKNYAYWIGATDSKTEGTWEWVTGEAFSFSAWNANQPDDYEGAEDHAEIISDLGKWNDNKPNTAERGFVCEYEVFFIPYRTVTYNGHIYSLYNESLSWTDAKAFCEDMGGHLVTVSDKAEQDAINQLFELPNKALYWIGLYDSNLDGTWEWVTGEPVKYTNWGSGEPSDGKLTPYGQAYSTNYSSTKPKGCWNDEYNASTETGYYRLANTGFICEIEPENFKPTASGYYNGNRYDLYRQKTTWKDADSFARTKGGHLVSITDVSEEGFVNDLFSQNGESNTRIWIGGFRKPNSDIFYWVNGERFVYSNWSAGEPNNSNYVEPFVEIYRTNEWNDNQNQGSADSKTFIVEYESPKQVLTLSNPDGTVLNRYKVQGGMPVDAPLKDYKTGYTAEWYKEPSLQNKWNFETDVITADTVLYAHWIPGVYKVSFDCGGLDSVNVTYGTAYGELPVPERAGYSFLGWFADEAYENPIDENSVVSITADHTLYAKWQAETYTVRFECNGGTADMPQKNVTFGTPYGELPSCVRAGSEFLGWYSDSDCIYPVGENDVVNVPNNHTLYAGWVESAVTGLKIVTKPNKTEYYVGDSLDAAGLVARATYANGSAGDITADRMTYSLTEFTTAGKKIVKAYYGEKYVSFIVNVKNRNLTSVSVEALPNKLVYTVGESLDTSGLILKAVYDDSSIKTVTDGFDVLCSLDSAGTKTVTVNYTENGVTKSASYQITVNAKSVQPDAVVTVDSASATAGEIISVPFRIENNASFMGFAITVDYDAEAFTPVSVNAGELLSEGILENSIGSAYEYLKVVFVATDNVKADGELFTVDFMVNENASGDYSFEVSYLQPDTFNEDFDNVVFKCNNFDISVSNAEVDSSTVISGGNVEVQAGEAISVPLYIKNGVGLSSFSIELKYNGKKLAFSSASAGEVIGGKVNATVAETADKVVIEWNGSPVTKDGVLLNITFEAAEYVQSCENVFVLCQNAGFENGTAKNVVCTDALVNISNPLDNQSAEIYSKNYLRIVDSVIEIPVYIRNNHGMMGFGMTFEYDASVITPIEAVAGDMFSSGKGY
ncbi:MAG: leucine-rich repeat protein, partial [Clostridia bacterium]|nr:leucine-rich repeat protein [Clostridia bacterium]